MLKYYNLLIVALESVINFFIVLILNIKTIFQRNRFPKGEEYIQIIGNGPSLNDDLPKIFETSKSCETLVVNTFANSDLFDELKPRYYVIVDPYFFFPENRQRHIEIQKKTIESLIAKTSWELNLLIPANAVNSVIVKQLKLRNTNIKVIPIKNIPTIGGFKFLNQFFFKLNLANPFFANVLVAAIFFCIKMNFKNILIWGADHSWHHDFYLGKDNILYTPERHFFDKDKKIGIPYTNEAGVPMRFDEVLLMLARGFREYHMIRKYADSLKVNIANLSSNTWVDAFNREIFKN